MKSNNVLPYPSINFVPKIFRDNPDDGTTALTNKLDSLFETWEDLTKELNYLRSVDKCPAAFLDELGYLVNAGIFQEDTEAIKRKKIFYAIQGHKVRGSWTQDAKPKVDAITGTDTELVNNSDYEIVAEWILIGENNFYGNDKYGTMAGDAGTVTDELGLLLSGDGDDIELAGNVYIDLKSSTLTAAQIQQIRDNLEFDIAPAYFRIFLGYFSGSLFVVYANGIIE